MGTEKTNEKTVLIAGGGPSALAAVDEFLRKYKETHAPAARLIVVAASNFGRGDPYAASGSVLKNGEPKLNQPKRWMSPFPHIPNDYADWCAAQTGKPDTRTEFTMRRTFGDYGEERGRELLATKLPGLDIQLVKDKVVAVRPKAGGSYDVALAGGKTLNADIPIIAIGSTPSNAFKRLNGDPDYVPFPTDRKALTAIAAQSVPSSTVTIIGSGPSMIDAVRFLEASRYQGGYEVISRKGWGPWALEHHKHDPQNSKRLLAYAISEARAETLTSKLADGADPQSVLRNLYREERKIEPRVGYLHVLQATPFDEMAEELRKRDRPKAAEDLLAYRSHAYANPAPPDAIRMLNEVAREGRIVYVQGTIKSIVQAGTPDRAVENQEDLPRLSGDRAFNIRFADGGTRPATTLINAAPYTKGAGMPVNGHLPLFAQMIGEKVIKIDDRGIVETDAAGQARRNLMVIGPASHTKAVDHPAEVWGVESFRDKASAAGGLAALALHDQGQHPGPTRQPQARHVASPQIQAQPARPAQLRGTVLPELQIPKNRKALPYVQS